MASSAGSAARYNTWISQPLFEKTNWSISFIAEQESLQVIWKSKDPIIREGGDIELFIRLVSKVFNNVFFIPWRKNFGDFY